MIAKLRQNSLPVIETLQRLLRDRLFLVTTVIPTSLAIFYFGLIASDVYVSESRFIVRSPAQQVSSPLGMLFKGATGFSKADDDSYAIQEYILSRDALKSIEDELHLHKAFASSKVDMISRFGAIDWDNSFEALYLYYQKKVSVQLDSASSIITLTTRAFTADDAGNMNQKLLDLAENFVNRLNERAHQDQVRFATAEVMDAEKKAQTAAMALAHYRNRKGVIDPEKESMIPLQQIGKLQEELIATKGQILQLEKFARDNPQLPMLRQKATMLESEIQIETSRVAGGDTSLAGKAVEYQRFALEREFADKMLASAMNTLEQARNEAQRKQLYLERIARPVVPDKAMEPHRMRNVLATLLVGLILWGILSILVAGVKEHHDR
ncbi:MAG: hypothetical protein JSR19_05695 [Proteobacteria bacterium]|nr:hypothetical protein [Pseudomonadota bacterium]HQR04668.1 hypothetical protein [Rhodocyclaceae bacterium]